VFDVVRIVAIETNHDPKPLSQQFFWPDLQGFCQVEHQLHTEVPHSALYVRLIGAVHANAMRKLLLVPTALRSELSDTAAQPFQVGIERRLARQRRHAPIVAGCRRSATSTIVPHQVTMAATARPSASMGAIHYTPSEGSTACRLLRAQFPKMAVTLDPFKTSCRKCLTAITGDREKYISSSRRPGSGRSWSLPPDWRPVEDGKPDAEPGAETPVQSTVSPPTSWPRDVATKWDIADLKAELSTVVQRAIQEFTRSFGTDARPRYMDVKQCAAYIGRSEQALRGLLKRRQIRPLPGKGRRVQFDREKVDAWMARPRG
jgi:hypothetical protein